MLRLRPLELDPTQMALVLKHVLLIEVLFKAPRRLLEVDQIVPHLVLAEANFVVNVADEQMLKVGFACNCFTYRSVNHSAGLWGVDLEDLQSVEKL